MRLALLAALLFALPVRAESPSAAETVSIILADASITLDVCQSIQINNRAPAVEENRFLGRHPSSLRLIAEGGLLPIALATSIWWLLPSGLRWAVPVAILPVEAVTIADNAGQLGALLRF